ncbi:MAG: hypothetical protein Q9167_000813 [Letrouitia subvulpina]
MRPSLFAGAVFALSWGQTHAQVAWGGVNIAGFDFGCETTGACDLSKVVPPLKQYGGQDGAAQMLHFVKDDGLNVFRLPVGWQYIVDAPGGTLNANFDKYDALVKACLVTGAYCMIDIHNYARWNGQIIGAGGPSNEDFAGLWGQIAAKYKASPKVGMGLMNEPHEMPDIDAWAKTCQAAVNAIRQAGATEHYIFLPGNGYTSAGSFVSSGSADALATVTDNGGSSDKLVFEVHKYLDGDNSGKSPECVSNQIDAFQDLTQWLTQKNRKAILAEVGGGPNAESCVTDVCALLNYLNQNSAVYLGYVGWGAGSFDQTYELSLSPPPSKIDQDGKLMTQCFAGLFKGQGGTPTNDSVFEGSGGAAISGSGNSFGNSGEAAFTGSGNSFGNSGEAAFTGSGSQSGGFNPSPSPTTGGSASGQAEVGRPGQPLIFQAQNGNGGEAFSGSLPDRGGPTPSPTGSFDSSFVRAGGTADFGSGRSRDGFSGASGTSGTGFGDATGSSYPGSTGGASFVRSSSSGPSLPGNNNNVASLFQVRPQNCQVDIPSWLRIPGYVPGKNGLFIPGIPIDCRLLAAGTSAEASTLWQRNIVKARGGVDMGADAVVAGEGSGDGNGFAGQPKTTFTTRYTTSASGTGVDVAAMPEETR